MGASVFLAAILLAGQTKPQPSFDDRVQTLADNVRTNLTLFDSMKSKIAKEDDAKKLLGQLAEKMGSIASSADKLMPQAKSDEQRIKLAVIRFEALVSTEQNSDKIVSLASDIATKYRESTAFAPVIESMIFPKYLTNEHYAPFDAIVKQSKNNEVIASANLANYFIQTIDDTADINKFRALNLVLPDTMAGKRAGRVYDFRTKLGLGSPFPPLDIELINGSTIKTQNLLGKVVVIDFWGFWCTACVGEMPEIKDYVTKNPNKLVWIGVNTDYVTKAFLAQKIKETGISWRVSYAGSPSGQLLMDIGIITYPSKIIIDSFGIVRYVPAVTDWRRVLDDALNKA